MFWFIKSARNKRLQFVIANEQEAERQRADMERIRAMRQEQSDIQHALGFDVYDDAQSWLRLHQLLKSHEDRIARLEGKA